MQARTFRERSDSTRGRHLSSYRRTWLNVRFRAAPRSPGTTAMGAEQTQMVRAGRKQNGRSGASTGDKRTFVAMAGSDPLRLSDNSRRLARDRKRPRSQPTARPNASSPLDDMIGQSVGVEGELHDRGTAEFHPQRRRRRRDQPFSKATHSSAVRP
jgi:hypothetical protein